MSIFVDKSALFEPFREPALAGHHKGVLDSDRASKAESTPGAGTETCAPGASMTGAFDLTSF